jgi:DNA-directed RNA polymerase III subunit RPC4
VKTESRPRKTGTVSKVEHKDPEYPDEDGSLPRIDIQNINLISSDEDVEEDVVMESTAGHRPKGKSQAGANKGGLKPIRLDRHEHKERISQVTTAPTVKDVPTEDARDSDTPMVDEVRSTRARTRGSKGTIADGKVQVKEEPAEPMHMTDQEAAGLEASRAATEPASKHREVEGGDSETVEDEPLKRPKRKPYVKKRGAKFVIQTEEDRGEWERHLEDLEVLKEELGRMQDATGKGKARAGDAQADKEADKKEGRLYLFQFPPAMPKLFNPATIPKSDPAQPAESSNTDLQVIRSVNKTVVDLDREVKPEEEEEVIKKEDDESPKKIRESLAAEEGYVGKLIVRESGRVELDWGSSRMLVGRGIETSFLSMGVLVDSKGCFDHEGKPTGEGVATGMGQIMGKFVVTPDWESMVDDIERAERQDTRK